MVEQFGPDTLVAEPLPLARDKDGVIRVGGTRVTLDSVVYAFQDGASAEEIAYRYPSLSLADVYAVIAYYLAQQDAVDQYLAQQEALSAQMRKQMETRYDAAGLRERLLARRGRQKV